MTHIVEIIINFLSSLLQIESSAFNKLILVEVVKMMNNVWYRGKWYIRALKLFCSETAKIAEPKICHLHDPGLYVQGYSADLEGVQGVRSTPSMAPIF